MVIFIPKGNDTDHTRLCEYYDGTCNYLKERIAKIKLIKRGVSYENRY